MPSMTLPGQITVLLIEDNPADALLLEEALSRNAIISFQLISASRLEDALALLLEHHVDVILLDLGLPDCQGIESFERVQAEAPYQPIIVLSGSQDEELAVQAVHAGAQDYLVKSQQGWEIISRTIRYAIERQQAQAELAASERRFRVLIENSSDAIAMVSREGIFLYQSPSSERLMGRTASEVVGQSIFDWIHPDDLEYGVSEMEKVIQKPGDPIVGAARYQHKNGGWRWIELTVTNLLEEPSIRAIIINYRDITERKISDSLLRFRLRIAELAPAVHIRGLIQLALEEAEQITGSKISFFHLLEEDQRTIGMPIWSASTIEAFGGGSLEYYPRQVPQAWEECIKTRTPIIQNEPESITPLIGQQGNARFLIPCQITIPVVQGGMVKAIMGVGGKPGSYTGEDLTVAQELALIMMEQVSRKRAEELMRQSEIQLRQSEERLSLALETSGMGVWGLNWQTDTFVWSPECLRICGLETFDGKLQTFLQYVHPDDAERVVATAFKALHENLLHAIEFRIIRPSGELRWVSSLGRSRFDEDGHELYFIGTIHDVTSRKRSEEELRLAHFTLKQVADAVFWINEEARITDVNASACKMLGYSREELLTKTLYEIDPGVTLEEWRESWEYMKGARARSGERAHILKSGQRIAVEVQANYFEYDNKAFVCAFARDISDRKNAEEKLRESQQRLSEIVNSITDGFYALDRDWKFTHVNETALRFFNKQKEEMLGHQINEVLPEGEGDVFQQSFRMAFDDNHAIYLQEKSQVSERTIELHAYPGPENMTVLFRDITDRIRMEAALRESEERLNLALTAAGMGVWEWDLRKKTVFWSPECYRIMRVDSFNGSQSAFLKLLHRDDVRPVIQTVRHAMGSKTTFAAEFRAVCPDGEVRWLSTFGRAMYDESGRAIRLIGTAHDISEWKRTQTERQVLMEIMQGLFVAADLVAFLQLVHRAVAMVIKAENFFVILYNKTTGMFEEAYAVDQYDLPFTSAKLEKSISAYVYRTGQPILMTAEEFKRLEEIGELELVGTPTTSWLGVPLKTYGETIGVLAVQDYDDPNCYTERDRDFLASIAGQLALAVERKRAEEEAFQNAARTEALDHFSQRLAASGTREKAVLDILAHELSKLLGDDCIIRMSSVDGEQIIPAAAYFQDGVIPPILQSLMEIAPRNIFEGMIGQVFRTQQSMLLSSSSPALLESISSQAFLRWIEKYQVSDIILLPLRAQGSVIGAVSLNRCLPKGVYSNEDVEFAQDLADRAALAIINARLLEQVQQHNAELELRVTERTTDLSRANAELERAARAKDEFLASMSHELRTPLNAILTLTESLEEGIYGAMRDTQVRPLRTVAESGHHLLNLINDILDLSKIEAGKMALQIAPVEIELVCQASLRLVKQQAQKKRLHVTLELDKNVLFLNADARCLKQMMVNLLSNAVKFTPEGGQIGLEVRGDTEQGVVLFTVWDSGIGISPTDAPRLFQPFVQVDSGLSRQYGGTGLGLSLVYRMAELHRGSISMSSIPGQGSRFTIRLPWDRKGDQAAPVDMDPSYLPSIQKALIIEDSPTAADQMERYLNEVGAQVFIQPAGENALQRAAEVQPDVILLDVLLPGLNGWEVLDQLKSDPRTRGIPVIVVTVINEPERGIEMGAADYLVKPFNRAQLYQSLRRANRQPVPPRDAEQASQPPRRQVVLIAEDNPANQTTFSDYLSAKGYHVLLAANGVEAIERVREDSPDLILMDIQMPGMDGLEAIQRIRSDIKFTHTPIIALTALAMPGDRERCISGGANEYLTKPVSLRKLAQAVNEFLSRTSA